MRHTAIPLLLLAVGSLSRTRGGDLPGGPLAPSPAQQTPWRPPEPPVAPPRRGEPPAFLRQPGVRVPLALAVDLALRNGTATRDAWLKARAAAAEYGAKRGEYFPVISAGGNFTRSEQSAQGGKIHFQQTSYGPTISLTWLLLDFGGRSARVDQARAALLAADWRHDAAIQDTIYATEQAYFDFQGAKALRTAAQAAQNDARAHLDAAQERRRVGAATIADVLTAQTAVSEAELASESAEGRIAVLRGALLAGLGLPVTLDVDVEELPVDIQATVREIPIERLLDEALAGRPDLVAQRAEAEKAESKAREVRSEGLPTIGFTTTAGRVFYEIPAGPPANNFSIGVTLNVPVFSGGRNHYDALQRRLEADEARNAVRMREDVVITEVFAAYHGELTAARQLKSGEDLLIAATQSEAVAQGRYQAGVGSMLELLTAQRSLSAARAQTVQSSTGWLLAVARLARATGTLEPPSATLTAPLPASTPATVPVPANPAHAAAIVPGDSTP